MDNDVHSPEMCGLAIALPLERRDIEQALAGANRRDYLSGAESIDLIWEQQRPAAEAICELAARAKELGVKVVEYATLKDVGLLFGTRRVVTILAHWRGANLAQADLKLESGQIISRLVEAADPVALALRESISQARLQEIAGIAGEHGRQREVANILNKVLKEAPLPGAVPVLPAGVEYVTDSYTKHTKNRQVLDAWWPEAFTRGNCLELEDGLFPASVVGSIVPQDWTGTFDLSNCYSSQLAGAIKNGRGDRRSIANDEQVDARGRSPVLVATYELLSSGGWSYEGARMMVARGLLSAESAHSQSRSWLARLGAALFKQQEG
jgi:hypothetical protein